MARINSDFDTYLFESHTECALLQELALLLAQSLFDLLPLGLPGWRAHPNYFLIVEFLFIQSTFEAGYLHISTFLDFPFPSKELFASNLCTNQFLLNLYSAFMALIRNIHQ